MGRLSHAIEANAAAFDARARRWAEKSQPRAWAYEFLLFGLKQAWACLFGALMLTLLVSTYLFWPDNAPLARYDFLVVASLAIQVILIATKLESWDEAIVIFMFHATGTIMEIFKVAQGSWIYPEESVIRLFGVPLFSGFMYACIGSYIARAFRLFDIRFIRYPPVWTTWALAILAYINFFSHHFIVDIRIGLFAFSVLIFWRTWFVFTTDKTPRRLPVLVGLIGVALFIWIAENIATFARTWVYPSQQEQWHLVSIEKMGAWYLLMLLSYVLVTLVHKPRAYEGAAFPGATGSLRSVTVSVR